MSRVHLLFILKFIGGINLIFFLPSLPFNLFFLLDTEDVHSNLMSPEPLETFPK